MYCSINLPYEKVKFLNFIILLKITARFRWTLTKAMEFMNNKKFDMEVQKHFLNQLFLFETRLNKSGFGPKTSSFSEISNENDLDEVLLRNTYLNGLDNKLPSRPYTSDSKIGNKSKSIIWADKNDINRKDLLCNINPQKELYFIKDIKPVMNHKKMIPSKSCIKRKSYSSQGSRSPYKDRNGELQNLLNTGNNYNPNGNFVSVKGYNSNSLNNSNNIKDKDGNSPYNKSSKITNDQNANKAINNSNIGNYPNLGIGIKIIFLIYFFNF